MTAASDGTGRPVVQVFERTAAPALQPFVQRFLVVEFPSFHHDVHLPDARAVAAFSLRGRVRIDGAGWAPPAAFTGPRERLRTHDHHDDHAVLLATFTPAGAAAFLRLPLDALTATTADLADVLDCPAELDRLRDRLAAAPDHAHRITQLEAFLLGRIQVSAPDPLVAAAIDWLERGAGNQRIRDLTRHIGLSQSALERRFRRVVGISPKRYASVVRLRRAVRLRAAGADLTTVAHAAGYFDQSHFSNDFRQATGSPPDTFFRPSPVQ